MNLVISSNSAVPLYEQIETQLKGEILSGRLAQGQALPSIRHLASQLRVSIITAKRAYDDLEKEGFIRTIQGKGTFVSVESVERMKELFLSQLEEKLFEWIGQAREAGLSRDEFINIVDALWEESE